MNLDLINKRVQPSLFASALVFLVLAGGCQVNDRKSPDLATQSDRLMQAYPELQSGRFAVIADFEHAVHMELLQLIGVSEEARCVLDSKGGRAPTGGRCVRFTSAVADDTVLIGNEVASNWYMKRDWRRYDLLLMSVRSPRPGLGVNVLISAGPIKHRLAVESTIALEAGWNVLRLDLAELGERIPLDDIRDIRLSLAGADKPTDLYIDDILLTAYEREMLGDARAADGSLYVQQVGRRWKVGAAGRFELTFSHGQIVDWYHLSSDPYRLGNLVRGTVFGPSPVVVADDDSGGESRAASDFSSLGRMVKASQRIIEMSEVRVVVACDWYFVDDQMDDVKTRPFQRWVYTIYPTGQIYVDVECTASTKTWSPPRLGLAVSLSREADYTTYAHSVATLDAPEPLRHVLYATARSRQPDGVLLLFAMHDSHATPRMIEQVDSELDRLSFIATGPRAAGDVQRWQCLLTLATSSEVSGSQVGARVLDYTNPARLDFQVGGPAAAFDGQAPGQCFDPARGCYQLRPEGSRLRFKIKGARRERFSPVFCVEQSQGLDAWIYVNHLIFQAAQRDSEGNLVFQLPGTITGETMVEVLLRQKEQGVPPTSSPGD